MSALDPEVIRKIRQWLAYADDDLAIARHAPGLGDACPCRLVAYHAQQCVEKCLKAFLIYYGLDFPYTHNIGTLLELRADYAPWPLSLTGAEELTPYAITARYPGVDDVVTREDALRAIDIAERVRGVVRGALGDRGIDLESPH